MARDYEKQHLFQHNGYVEDCGYIPFVTTGATLDIYTPLSKIYFAEFFPVCSTADTNPCPGESFYIADAVGATDGAITVSGGVVTVGRTGEHFVSTNVFGTDQFASEDLLLTTLFTAPFAMELESVVWANAAQAWAGSPADSSPADNVNAQAITATAYTATSVTIAEATVASGAVIAALTAGGTTNAPIGSSLTITGVRALSSATKIFYRFVGID
jgi:hypothetical protein